MDEHNPYAAPVADVTPPPAPQQARADRGERFVASLVDGFLAMLIVFPLMIPLGLWEAAQANQITFADRLLLFAIGTGVLFALNGYLLARHGQTIGKRLLGIRIVDRKSGQVPSLGHIYFWRMLPLQLAGQLGVLGQLLTFIDALFIFREDKRCLHDIIAGTVVVKVPAAA